MINIILIEFNWIHFCKSLKKAYFYVPKIGIKWREYFFLSQNNIWIMLQSME